MRTPRSRGRVVGLSVVAVLGLSLGSFLELPAQAQCDTGEYALHQNGTVGWVRVSSDRAVEWWAYIADVYDWADSSSVGSNKWRLDAEYLGAAAPATYEEWKSSVLQRSAAQGHTIVFQWHEVTEESVEN